MWFKESRAYPIEHNKVRSGERREMFGAIVLRIIFGEERESEEFEEEE
jgi:hypothetical protein